MLRVTIALAASGLESGKRTLVVAEIGNIGGADLVDYGVEVKADAINAARPLYRALRDAVPTSS